MTSLTTAWLLGVGILVVAAWLIGYRLGIASLRPTVATLTEQLRARDALEQSVTPVREAMTALQSRVDEAERSRLESLSRLSEQVLGMQRHMNLATGEVREQAQRIAGALGRTQTQGVWGEMQLRRVVEAAGMMAHVHFAEQVTLPAGTAGTARPDMVIDLGAGRSVVVDSKVSLDALLDPDLTGDAQAAAHAAAISDHLGRLSAKQYWKAAGSPEFVIMFLPAEHMLGIALQSRPDLLQTAFERRVVLATPTTLMATLSSVGWAWQQAEVAGQAKEVLRAGQVVHQRLTTMSRHVTKLGKDLGGAVEGYNQFVASLEARVLPATRRLSGLCAPGDEVVDPEPIDLRTRAIAVDDTG